MDVDEGDYSTDLFTEEQNNQIRGINKTDETYS